MGRNDKASRWSHLVLGLALFLAACGEGTSEIVAEETPPSSVADDNSSIAAAQGAWDFIDGTVAPLPEAVATIVFSGNNVSGTAFCNDYGGAFDVDAQGRIVAEMAKNDMACIPSLMQAESQFMAVVSQPFAVRVDGDELTVTSSGGELRFIPAEPPDLQSIQGVTWELTGLIAGDIVRPAADTPAMLRLEADGSFTGSTGCRELTGRWITNGAEILFPEMSAAGECDGRTSAQDSAVIEALEGNFRASVAGDMLLISSGSDLTLRYVRS